MRTSIVPLESNSLRISGLKLWVVLTIGTLLSFQSVWAGDFQPDPLSVQRFGSAYRYPQQGWWVLHIEGEPYERGVQHGRLMWSEITAHIRCFAAMYSSKAPDDAWDLIRVLTDSLFLHGFEREYLEEMRGIADGVAQAGGKFDERAIDLTDIVALNLWPEIMTLPWASNAVPTGLEGIKFPDAPAKPASPPKPGHCSAFAATGPATADGKIVFGHITMFDLYASTFYNLWLDVKPAKGHRVLMQSFPGGIHSGMDYYLNSAGILVSETTLDQTRFDKGGAALAGRIRKALQYSDSIDQVVEILKSGNNGLYTNEWLLADIKTNEIAMFELGTAASKLYRSSKGEWFGGTEGFYWGCNNTKDLAVRLETIAAANDRPANMVWNPSDRDLMWVKLYNKHKGTIDENFGREAFTTPPLCAIASVDAKFTTTDLAKGLKTWAIFGPPRERTWKPTFEEQRKYPEVEPLVSHPWTILHAGAPPNVDAGKPPEDLKLDEDEGESGDDSDKKRDRLQAPPKIVWRGTILPKTEADIWLAAAFADYHPMVEMESRMIAAADDKCLCAADYDKLSVNLFGARSRYLTASRASVESPLSRTKTDDSRDEWYRMASGKGVLLLNELRRRLGDDRFIELMDSFGTKHAGQPVAWGEFAAQAAQIGGEGIKEFFEYWVNGTGLPLLKLASVTQRGTKSATNGDATYRMDGVLHAEGGPLPDKIEVTVEMEDDELTEIVSVESNGAFTVETEKPPHRLIVDKYGRVAKANGGVFDLYSFAREQEQTLIIYGTLDDAVANREAADVIQLTVRNDHSNYSIPILADYEVSEDDVRRQHLILIGRPTTNRWSQRFRDSLPVSFGTQSFTVRGKHYAHPKSAILAAGPNPLDPRFGMTIIAGLSGLATYQSASRLGPGDFGAEVKLLANGRKPQRLVIPPPELVYEFSSRDSVSQGSPD